MILDDIKAKTLIRVQQRKERIPEEELRMEIEKLTIDLTFPFEQVIKKRELSFICEVKKEIGRAHV